MANELILIVEDNDKNRKLARKVLEKAGYRTREVVTGEEAITAARETPPDLILLDYLLPGIDGIETLKRIRADRSIPHMPIIAITASAMPEEMVRMGQAGFEGFMTKPVNLKVLLGTIESLLARAKAKTT